MFYVLSAIKTDNCIEISTCLSANHFRLHFILLSALLHYYIITRQTLTQLGVLMVSEDPETYDIHGDLMGGWPTVVKPVVATMRTLNYIPPSGPVGGKG